MQPPFDLVDDAVAQFWLFDGHKYDFSKTLAGSEWDVPAHEALLGHGVDISTCRDLEALMRLLAGKFFWGPDPVFQLWDTVDPPSVLLAKGLEDCDGQAMIHAQAAEFIYKGRGCTAYILTMFTDPWEKSHHIAALVDSEGKVYIVQPQPNPGETATPAQMVAGPFPDFKTAADTVMSWYDAKVVKYDVRTPTWAPTGLQ